MLQENLADTLSILDGPLNRIRVRFRFYRSVDALLDNQFSRQFTAKRSLSKTAEGTPNITKAILRGGLISRSRIEVGLHYFADTNGDGGPDLDRLATAVLTDFSKWEVRPQPEFDNDLLKLKSFHKGFSAPPRGSIGDRDQIIFDGVRLELQEAQYVPGDYSSWRLFLIDPRNRVPRPLEIDTGGDSRPFGNPTATALTAPSGRPGDPRDDVRLRRGRGPQRGRPAGLLRRALTHGVSGQYCASSRPQKTAIPAMIRPMTKPMTKMSRRWRHGTCQISANHSGRRKSPQ